jgi:hypothetical protein
VSLNDDIEPTYEDKKHVSNLLKGTAKDIMKKTGMK